MISYILYQISSYQIFSSILFRGAMGYLTAYLVVSWLMPILIIKCRKKKLFADYNNNTPIMGGVLLILAVLVAILLWGFIWDGPFILALIISMVGFGLIGFWDDLIKVKNRNKIKNKKKIPNNYSTKADGLSERFRISIEIVLSLVILAIVFIALSKIDTRLQIPFVPIKNYFPELSIWLYYPAAVLLIVIGANSINMADGLDTLATIPMITCLAFIAIVAYISGDTQWSTRLKIPFLYHNTKEIAVLCCIMIGSLVAFLKYNSPPASIYMGDIGSLGFGSAVTMSFIFIKAEIFLALVGGIFLITGLSSLIQRGYFKLLLKIKGREYASKNRFFFRAPYHHHIQAKLIDKESDEKHTIINSLFDRIIKQFKFFTSWQQVDKPKTVDGINSKIVWHYLIRSIFLLVIALIVFLKIR